MSAFMKDPERIKHLLSDQASRGETPEEVALKVSQEESMCPTLSLKQRVTGYIICTAIGLLMNLFSFGILFSALTGQDLQRFAVPYAVGALLSIAGTLFLSGPLKQLKKMFDSERICATLVFLTSIAMVLFSALVIQIELLVLAFIVVQYLSFIWYSISYIPYGRQLLVSCVKGLCN